MLSRRVVWIFVWGLLWAVGCAGGCGEGCLAPVPGGFPPAERASNALSVKLTKEGIAAIEGVVADMLLTQLGQTGFSVPCADLELYCQNVPIGSPICVRGYLCDLDNNMKCDAADASHPSRAAEGACEADMAVDGIRVTPVQNVSGSVDVKVEVDLRVNTGVLPINSQQIPLSTCSIGCTVEYDSDHVRPDFIPVVATLRLKVDPANHDILAFDMPDINDIASAIDEKDLRIGKVQNGCSATNWSCSALDINIVKSLIFKQLQGMITRQIRDAVDGFRCLPCEAGTNACPGTATCASGVCYTDYRPNDDPAKDVRVCPPNVLGVEGRANLGDFLGDFGARDAELDVSLVMGGRNADGKPATAVQAGGLVLGMLGGTDAPEPSSCVPPVPFTMPAQPAPMDFDAEVGKAVTGNASLAGYHVGISLSDRFLDKSMYDLWRSGGLCLDIGQEQVDMISSGLFTTFIPSLGVLTEQRNVPMLIALRPRDPPRVMIGRGSVKPGPNGSVPDDPLLTLELPNLHIDFYAYIEERYVRLFTLGADVRLPLGLEFDPAGGTVTPVLAGLKTLLGNARGFNNEMLAEEPQAFVTLIDSVIGLVEPQLANALAPIALPEVEGFKLEILGARGSVEKPSGAGGYEHLALFAKLGEPNAPRPYTAGLEAHATLRDVVVPPIEELRTGATPSVVVQAEARGVEPRGFMGYEYSWRVDGGLWRPWTRESLLHIEAASLRLEGRHAIDVRARRVGELAPVEQSHERVLVDMDWSPPTVALELDLGLRAVRTRAYDLVTPPERLAYRYRVRGGEWSDWGGNKLFELAALGDEPFLEVEVRDAAGHVARAAFGGLATESVRGQESTAGGGCASAGVGSLALLGLVAVLRRKRGRERCMTRSSR